MLHKNIRGQVAPITVSNQIHYILRRFQMYGVKAALLHYTRRIPERIKERLTGTLPTAPAAAEPSCDFAGAFGVGSEHASRPDILRIQSENKKWGLPYERSSQRLFRQILESLPVALENYVFVDLGAGKGLALCLAAEYPFKKAVGIEYSQALAVIAQKNIATYGHDRRKCGDVECIFGDAVAFEFPPEPLIIYIYNAFQGKAMDQVIVNLEKSLKERQRDIWILYANPLEHRKFRRSRVLEVIESTWDYSVFRARPALK